MNVRYCISIVFNETIKSKEKINNKEMKVFEWIWKTTNNEAQFIKSEKRSASRNNIYFWFTWTGISVNLTMKSPLQKLWEKGKNWDEKLSHS